MRLNTRGVRHRLNAQGGFSIIEVMLSVLILSLGILGLSAVQGRALNHTNTSYLQGLAANMAYDMAERMTPLGLGDQASPFVQAPTYTAACYTAAGCTRDQMILSEVSTWQTEISRALPRGAGVVCLDSNLDDDAVAPIATSTAPKCDGLGKIYAIKVWWAEDRSGNLRQFTLTY